MRTLLVTSRFPLPAWRGNQVRTVEWLRAVRGERRVLVCPKPADPAEGQRLYDDGVIVCAHGATLLDRAAALVGSLAKGLPAQECLYATGAAREALSAALTEHRPDVAVVQMVRCGWALEQIRREAPSTRIVFDAIDAMGLHFERAARSTSPFLRPLVLAEAARSRRRERELAGRADAVVAVAARDLEYLGTPRGLVVPVSGRELSIRRADPPQPVVLLSGNLGYRPTVDGALWFAREVWPEVAARLPHARWVLAGARPRRVLRRLARLPGVEVHADVESLEPFLASAAVAIAPMASGSGVPMKVLEAWAAGVPVVAHPWTAGGLDPAAREALVVADSPAEWRARLTELLTDAVAARALAARGLEAWRTTYHPDRVAEGVRAVVAAAHATRR